MKNGEKSFGRLFELVEILAQTHNGMTGKTLAELSGIPASTTFRMLKFLVKHDFLCVDRGVYTLGVGFVRWGNVACKQNPLIKAARPVLEELSYQTGETVHLAKLRNDKIVYIDKVEGKRPTRMGSLIGKLNPLHCTGVGKAIFAFQTAEVQAKLLAGMEYTKFTATTIITEEAMRRELELIRQQGYAVDNCEHENWVYCIAAPILTRSGECIAGISISGTDIYMKESSEKLTRLITAASRRISENLM